MKKGRFSLLGIVALFLGLIWLVVVTMMIREE